MRFFNTAGPVNPADHYCLPPLERIDLPALLALIEQKKYFVLHAPQQTGKTSVLLALMHLLNRERRYRALYVNVELAQSAREDVGAAMQAILSEMGLWAITWLKDGFVAGVRKSVLADSGPHAALAEVLKLWSANEPRPLMLLIDEIDALVGPLVVEIVGQCQQAGSLASLSGGVQDESISVGRSVRSIG